MRDYEPLYTPLVGLASAWLPKAATAALLTWAIEIARAVGATYSALLATDAALVALIGLLIALDTITGITASRRAKRPLRSRTLRRTGYKVMEYSALGYAAVAIANGFSGSPFASVVSALDDAMLLYIALTEVYSITENVFGDGGARRALDWIAAVRRGETPPPPPAAT
jgi:hypothetical protein